ncbi:MULTISPECIES: GntR family transcriptional regulator [Enterobacteriaceae]|uniref:GntR family transcriptional regulator n=1 Tax=Enterobacteriaceae TaxID=543 RepID=UPI00098B7FA2|nr:MULTISPECIES: GntR family transcriptional regulator [Enterobacteriaceae]EKS6729921.1 GntR family transcriptional regulator [Enterobacter mori]EES0030183.1 GntR family transcriptional regulator [Escherichia coli]MBX8911101.1 GntR family transcriptional regulator [Enterobacter ludwigii]MCD9354857.1 GntR family transcriptional regulator [Klebsiella pneumoniae]MCD9375879.1 GntR family transcriptional regulator [Klebsiella pneumoniae]
MNKQDTKEGQARRPAGRYIYEELRRQILTLQLRHGEQLDEISLAAAFGLSRSPVRDAMARLVSEGLITILPNRTAIVTPFEIEEFPNYIAALDLMQRAVTRLAAIQRTDADLTQIRACNVEYMATVYNGDFSAMTEKNKEFHQSIARAAKNSYLTSYYDKLLAEGQRIQHLLFDFMVRPDAPMKPGQDHDDIINAITAGDAEAADHAAHEHTMLFQNRFLTYMQRNLLKDIEIDF